MQEDNKHPKVILKDEPRVVGKYIDVIDGVYDEEAHAMKAEMLDKVKAAAPWETLKHRRVVWVPGAGGITVESHGDAVRELCLDVRELVLTGIHKALLAKPMPDPLTREVLRHANLAAAAASKCLYRDAKVRQHGLTVRMRRRRPRAHLVAYVARGRGESNQERSEERRSHRK